MRSLENPYRDTLWVDTHPARREEDAWHRKITIYRPGEFVDSKEVYPKTQVKHAAVLVAFSTVAAMNVIPSIFHSTLESFPYIAAVVRHCD